MKKLKQLFMVVIILSFMIVSVFVIMACNDDNGYYNGNGNGEYVDEAGQISYALYSEMEFDHSIITLWPIDRFLH
ncbi:MAG: hypothetical protein FWE03_02970 [Firmicutes bacterium]|nr:hypothetical protein [Bacillota bacterium]